MMHLRRFQNRREAGRILATRLEEQYRQRPEGPHCENTKIWFYCSSAASLGMYLYDKVYNKQTHLASDNFLEYARRNNVGVGNDGKLQWVTSHYDPLIDFKLNGPAAGGALAAFLQYSQRFFRPIQDLSEKYNILQSAMASAERVFKLLDTPVEIVSPEQPVK